MEPFCRAKGWAFYFHPCQFLSPKSDDCLMAESMKTYVVIHWQQSLQSRLRMPEVGFRLRTYIGASTSISAVPTTALDGLWLAISKRHIQEFPRPLLETSPPPRRRFTMPSGKIPKMGQTWHQACREAYVEEWNSINGTDEEGRFLVRDDVW